MRLDPIIAAATLIKRHLHNVFAYFDHPITNAVADGINSKIRTIKKAAYEFRNPEHFKIATSTPLNQRQRWMAAALLDTEPRLRRVKGYRHLPVLRAATQRDLKIESVEVRQQNAA